MPKFDERLGLGVPELRWVEKSESPEIGVDW